MLSLFKLSLRPGGSLRGRGWKYGSGFVDGIFPVLGPLAQQIMDFVREEVDYMGLWDSLDMLPATNSTWDDIISVAVQLRLNKKWGPIILVGIYSDALVIQQTISKTSSTSLFFPFNDFMLIV